MQTRSGGLKPTSSLSVVLSVDETLFAIPRSGFSLSDECQEGFGDTYHEFGHSIPVIPWRTEGVFLNKPPRRKNYEVCDGGTRMIRWGSQYREDRGIWVIVGDRANSGETTEVVLVRVIEPVPGDHIKGRVGLSSGIEPAGEFAKDRVLRGAGVVFLERCTGGLEVTGIGEAG